MILNWKKHISRLFKKGDGIKRWKAYTTFILLLVVIGFLLRDACQSRNQIKDFGDQIAHFVSNILT